MKQQLLIVDKILQNMKRVIVGKDDQIRKVLCCWFSGGHLLIEDAPGTGKTMLARALAASSAVEFRRIQFTPDLLPSDITGSYIYSQKTSEFSFLKGPLLSTLVLADEINRATPRTQSALLESMAEGQTTIDGKTHKLDPLFFVVATQNPIEQHGTFPLPEAQLDRFMMKISMGYPSLTEEIALVKNQNYAHPVHAVTPVTSVDEIRSVRAIIPEIRVSDKMYHYVASLIEKTRMSPDLKLGASPRATIALVRAAQATALFEGLDHVRPNHVLDLFKSIVGHRVALNADARMAGKTISEVLMRVVEGVPVPVQ